MNYILLMEDERKHADFSRKLIFHPYLPEPGAGKIGHENTWHRVDINKYFDEWQLIADNVFDGFFFYANEEIIFI